MRYSIAAALAALAVLAPSAGASTHQGSSTSYSACSSGSRTAMGTAPHFGVVASNNLPLGTKIKLDRPKRINGRRYFRVEDRGGPGFLIDIYAPDCGWAIQYGRRFVKFHTVPRHRPKPKLWARFTPVG